MTVSFSVTEETPHVGRRPKPVPEYVTAAIETALQKGKNVKSGPLSEEAFKTLRADFRRAERVDPTVKCVVTRDTSEADGKLRALVVVTKLEKAAKK